MLFKCAKGEMKLYNFDDLKISYDFQENVLYGDKIVLIINGTVIKKSEYPIKELMRSEQVIDINVYKDNQLFTSYSGKFETNKFINWNETFIRQVFLYLIKENERLSLKIKELTKGDL